MPISRWLGGGNGSVYQAFNPNYTEGIQFQVNTAITISEIGIKTVANMTGLKLRIWRNDNTLMCYVDSVTTVDGWNWFPVIASTGGLTLQPTVTYYVAMYDAAANGVYTATGNGYSTQDSSSIPGTTISWMYQRNYDSTDRAPYNNTSVTYVPALGFSVNINTAPNAPTITAPTANQYLNTRTPTITWTFSDPDAGDTQSAFNIQIVNSAYSSVLWDSGWITGSQKSYAIPSGAITADGTYYVRMQVKDAAGVVNAANGRGPDANYDSIQFIADTTAPTANNSTITQYKSVAVGGTFRVQVTGVADNIGVSEVKFPTWSNTNGQDDIVWYSQATATKPVNAGGGTWYVDVPIADHANAEDIYFTDPYAYDNAGNSTGLGRVTTYVDRTPPTIGGIDGTSYNNVNTGTHRTTVTNVADSLSGIQRTDFWYRKSTDGGTTWGAWSGPITGVQSGSSWYYDVPRSGDGKYQVDTRAYDNAGNVSNGNNPVTTFFYVDSVAPAAPTLTIGTKTGTSVALSWTTPTDAAPSSGLLDVLVYIRTWNGSSWVDISGSPKYVGLVNSYTYTGLTANTQYHVLVQYRDNANNYGTYPELSFVTDVTPPAVPTQTNGILYAVSNGVTWSSFSDPSPSSGQLSTTLYLQSWNGSAYVDVSGFPKSVAGVSYSFTGLSPATQYRWAVVYTDNNGNANALTYTSFTTNSYPVSTINNLTSNGYVFNARPKIKFTVVDANDATLTDFETQFATDSAFTLNVGGNTAANASTQYNRTSAPSGSVIYYTPSADRAAGVWYVRTRAYDGKDWGMWSTAVTFTIQAVSWATVVTGTDTAISKRTIDGIRTKVNAVRQARGLADIVWTDNVINDWNNVSPTPIRMGHLVELRQAIVDIYTALAITVPTWTDNIIDTTINRKGSHWIDLRNALIAC